MRIAIFSTAVSYAGGAIITFLNVLPLLQQKGVEPYFILKGHGSLENILRDRGIPFVVIKSYDWCLPEKKLKGVKGHLEWKVKALLNAIAEIKTRVFLKKEHIDIYHLNCIYNGTGVKAAKSLNIPVVWHLREFVDLPDETTLFVNSNKAWEVINRADHIVCVSGYLSDFFKNKLLNKNSVKTVYDGIDMDKFKSHQRLRGKDDRIMIGFSGTAEVKNHKDIILALGKLKKSGMNNFTLRIAGKWSRDSYNQEYFRSVQQLILVNDLKDNVEIVGMQEDMNAFWSECDISVVCSKRESFGLAATEAMACGVPLICSDTSISDELTNGGDNVLKYTTGDADGLLIQVQRAIRELGSQESNNRAAEAEKFVRDRFTLMNSAESLYNVYMEVQNGRA